MGQSLMIVIGLVVSCFAWVAVPLSRFIMEIEDGAVCAGCIKKQQCFAKKEIKFLHSDYISEWMLLSFLKIRKSCSCIQKSSRKNKVWCFALCFAIFFVPLWSGGMSDVSFLYGIAATMLFFLSVVDWNTQYIPMECNIIIFICGLIHLFADFSNWVDYLIGLFAVSGFLLLVDKISTPLLRRKYEEEVELTSGIGDGDIKLMAATGLLIGWRLDFLALGIGCIAGSVIHLIRMKMKGSSGQLALGPYLSLGVYVTMICGEQLISWYLNMLGLKLM